MDLPGYRLIRSWRAPREEERTALVSSLAEDASLSFNFIVLTLAACAIATFGLLENNVAVIIGAMIIAPLILPIGAVSFGAIEGDVRMLRRSAVSLAAGSVLSIAVAAVLTRAFYLPTLGSEIMARSQPNLLDLGIAIAAGMVAAFAKIRPSIAGTIAGTAIAVALMPPICVVGIALAHGMLGLARGAALLYVTNLFGIMLASMAVYVAGGHVHLRRARHGLIWTAIVIAAIGVPLAASTGELLRQARVESALRTALLKGTVTFQRVELISTRFDWVSSPPVVTLFVQSTQPITPVQVHLLELYAKRKTGITFTFVFEVTPINEVQSLPARPSAAPIYPVPPVR